MAQIPEYDRINTFYEPPVPPNRKIWGKLLTFPFLLSLCMSGYEILANTALPSARTAALMNAFIFIPFSYVIMLMFYFPVCLVRFVVSRQPITNFWLKISYYPFIFGGWYYFICALYPINQEIRQLFLDVRLNDAHVVIFLCITVCALAILIKSHMLILNYRRESDDTSEEEISFIRKAAVYASVVTLNLVLILS